MFLRQRCMLTPERLSGRKAFVVAIGFLAMILSLSGCRTYYQKQQDFHRHFESGNIVAAAGELEDDSRADRRRNRLLYLMNQGVVEQMLGNYQKSNEYLEQAYVLGEDYHNDLTNTALTLLVNPKVTDYKGEPFELLMIHYYKAMNFIQLGDMDAALVECRRLNIKLNALEDRYEGDNRYRRDAFIHNLMGIIYDASGEYNNAFIAYRNALNIYEEDYKPLYGIGPPEQLKADLLRAAYRTGFHDQVDFYEKRFGMDFHPAMALEAGGDLVFFWQNGLGPVKTEKSLNFTLVRGQGGSMHFVNNEAGLSFPVSSSQRERTGSLGDLRVVRVAFPEYTQRQPVYHSALLRSGDHTVPFHLAQDINAIAFQAMDDRMFKEMGTALLRLALREATEQRIRKEDENIGALFGLLGAVSEQADTRNWQTLPHSILYTRIQLPEGPHTLELELQRPDGSTAQTVSLDTTIKDGQTSFVNFHTPHTK